MTVHPATVTTLPFTPTALATTSTTPTVTLPRRLDVHQVEHVVDQLVARTHTDGAVVADGSEVEMIDQYGLRALDELAADVPLTISNASVALVMTAVHTGHERLLDACDESVPTRRAA